MLQDSTKMLQDSIELMQNNAMCNVHYLILCYFLILMMNYKKNKDLLRHYKSISGCLKKITKDVFSFKQFKTIWSIMKILILLVNI